MAANITVIPGADPVDFYLGNYNYADILTDMEPLKLHWAVDRDSLIVKNAAGTAFDISRPYRLWKPDGSAVAVDADADGHLLANYGLSSKGAVGARSQSGRSDAQLEFVNNGTGHAMLGAAMLQNPGVTTQEVAWSGQGYDSAGHFVQMGAFYMRWGSTDPDTGWSTMGIHPNYLSGGSPVADVAFEVYGARGIGMFLDHNAEGTVTTPPVDRYLMIKRASGGKPSICGVSDIIIDANFGGAANTVYLNAYNAGDVNACVAGGTLIASGGAIKILGTNAVAKFAPTGVDEHWLMADYVGNFGIYNNTDDFYEMHINTSHNVGIGTYNQATRLHVHQDTISTANWENLLTVSRASSGNTDSGFGAGINFSLENFHGNMRDAATIFALQNDADKFSCDIEFHAYCGGSTLSLLRRAVIDGQTGWFGLGSASAAPVCPLDVTTQTALTNSIQEMARTTHNTSNTAVGGFGSRWTQAIERSHGGSSNECWWDFWGIPDHGSQMRWTTTTSVTTVQTTLDMDENELLFTGRDDSGFEAWVSVYNPTYQKKAGIRFYSKPFGGSKTLRQNIFWDDNNSLLHVGDQSTLVRIGPVAFVTPEGGFGDYETAGENLVKGEIVCYLQGGTSGRVYKCPTTGDSHDMPIGVVYANASTGGAVAIVKGGNAEVLPQSDVSLTMGYVITASTTEAGRVTNSSTPSTPSHWAECGHPKVNSSGNGVLTMCSIHHN